MATIDYPTGRDYDRPQVLRITAPAMPEDLLESVPVSFADPVRGISGTVQVMALVCMYAGRLNPSELGAAVLREYDAGRYTLA